MIDKIKNSLLTLIENKILGFTDLMDNHLLKLTTFLGISQTICDAYYPQHRDAVESIISAILVAMRG